MKLVSFVYRWPLTLALFCTLAALCAALGTDPTLVTVARQFLLFFVVLFIVSLFGRRNHPPR